MFCSLPNNLDAEKNHTYLWKKKNVKTFTYTVLSKFGRDQLRQKYLCCFFCLAECGWSVISESFFVWRLWDKIIFSWPWQLNWLFIRTQRSKKRDACSRIFSGAGQICGDIRFDNEYITNQKTKPGDGKYNLFSGATHESGHALGIFHSNEKMLWWHLFTNMAFQLKTNTRYLVKVTKPWFNKCIGKQEVLQWERCLTPQSKSHGENGGEASAATWKGLFSLWSQNIFLGAVTQTLKRILRKFFKSCWRNFATCICLISSNNGFAWGKQAGTNALSEAGELGGVSQNVLVVGKYFLKMV